MGEICSKPEHIIKNDRKRSNNNSNKSSQKSSRKVSITQVEIVIFKLTIQKERLISRITNLEKQESELTAKVKFSIQQNLKDQAHYHLKKKKLIRQNCNNYRDKLSFIQENILRVENAESDAQFTDILKDSNRTLLNLSKKIDLEEIETAKMLQKDGQAMRMEMNEMMNDSID